MPSNDQKMTSTRSDEAKRVVEQLRRRGLELEMRQGVMVSVFKVHEAANRLAAQERAMIEEDREALIEVLENQRIAAAQAQRTESDRQERRGYDFETETGVGRHGDGDAAASRQLHLGK